MDQETKALVEAIVSLRQEPNYFKEYIFPLAAGLFSSFLGAGVAYFTIRHQDNSLIQKSRIEAINNLVLCVNGAIQSLIAIKQNYHGKLTDNPYQRTAVVRTLIGSNSKIEKDIASLSFIVPRKDEPDTHLIKWRQLPRIHCMLQNYNSIIDMWDKRAELDRPIKEKLIEDHGQLAYADLSEKEIFASVGAPDFISLMDLTEKSIKFTDDLIIEMFDFLIHFPEVAISLTTIKMRNRYGPIITYSTGANEMLEKIMQPSTEVNYTTLSTLLGITEDELKAELTTGY